ncbi:MAG: conserved repeat domain protein [Deinococcus sp.]|nr:conserved repeat domain protein [Deinococcus sp.]
MSWMLGRRLISSLSLLAALLIWSQASAQQAFATRYSNPSTNGDIVLIGNVNYYCTTAVPPATTAEATRCATARAAVPGALSNSVTNNQVYTVPIDTDSDPSTANSSSATLNLTTGSSVLFAGLYWSGISGSATNRSKVSFGVPGQAVSPLTSTNVARIGNTYQSFVDVTALVQAGGNGAYTVANVNSTLGAGNWANWTLVVAYKNSALPVRNLSVFDGLQTASDPNFPLDITVSGFLTPSLGAVNSTIGVVAYDGDRGAAEGTGTGGSLQFGVNSGALTPVFNAANPVNDVFNSTISVLGTEVTAGRNPTFANTLGLDIDTFKPNTPLPNGSTSAVVRVIGSSGDVIYPGIITLATDIFLPNIKDSLTKTVTDVNGGRVLPGDQLEYELVIKNQGNDGAANVILTDIVPPNTSFVPGSLLLTGANAGAKTNAAGDDQAEYDSAGNRVVFRLGTGATALAGGLLLPGDEARVRFRVQVNAGILGGTAINNTGNVSYRQQTLGNTITDASDGNPALPGDQPATMIVSGPDLTLTKTHTGNFSAGQAGSFVLRVSNAAGWASSLGTVTVTDLLPAGMIAQSIGGVGWTCTLSPLRCTRSDSLAAGTAFPDITLTGVAANAGSYSNTASVGGGGEEASAGGNNSASDALTVVPVRPVVTLTKTVRNITRATAPGVNVVGLPGDVLEYCISFGNTGGAAPNFVLKDDLPAETRPKLDGYGTGLGLRLTLNTVVTDLTSVTDADRGELIGQNMKLSLGTLDAGSTGRICMQANIR